MAIHIPTGLAYPALKTFQCQQLVMEKRNPYVCVHEQTTAGTRQVAPAEVSHWSEKCFPVGDDCLIKVADDVSLMLSWSQPSMARKYRIAIIDFPDSISDARKDRRWWRRKSVWRMRACRRQDSTWHFPISRPAASREQSFCFSEISSTARPSALSKGYQARVAMVPTSANCRVKGHLCWSADSVCHEVCPRILASLYVGIVIHVFATGTAWR